MGETGQQPLNRAITVGAGTFVGVLVSGVVLGDRIGLVLPLLLGAACSAERLSAASGVVVWCA